MRKFKSFISDENGNFAVMFALVSMGLMAGVAAAIDIASMQRLKGDLQNHLDTAALAAVSEFSMNEGYEGNDLSATERDEILNDIVLKVLAENEYNLHGALPKISVVNDVLTVSAEIPYQLKFGNMLGMQSSKIGGTSQVGLPSMNQEALEIALVLDNTESMNFNGKMTALRQGARDFIEAIENTGSDSKIALVPFARYVDVGVEHRDAFWINVPAEYDTPRVWQQATHSGGTCHKEDDVKYDDGVRIEFERNVCINQTTTYEEKSTVVESRWMGCVGVRSGGRHLLDDSYNTEATRIQALHRHTPHEVLPGNWDESAWCPDTITPLTNDYNQLNLAVGGLFGTDRTYIPAGLIWGQRVLSPKAPFTESADTAANPKRQVMILMSDGQNTAYLQGGDEHESIPYVQDLSQKEQADGEEPPNTNQETAALCTSIKAEGIEIYTIAFQVEDAQTKNLLKKCASHPRNFIDAASNQALIASFDNISESLEANIRLMR